MRIYWQQSEQGCGFLSRLHAQAALLGQRGSGPGSTGRTFPLGSELTDAFGTDSSGFSVGLHWWMPNSLGFTVMAVRGEEGDARARAECRVPGGEVAEGEQCDLFNLHMESSVRHLPSPPCLTGAAHVFASPGPSLPS